MIRESLSYSRRGLLALLLITVLIAPAPNAARSESGPPAQCPLIVVRALETTEQLCNGTGRNQACYGHTALDAQPQPDVEAFRFEAEGDRANVSDVRSLRLSQMDQYAGTWGIALLRLQASLPDSSPDNVTVVLFGDVSIQNRVAEPVEIPISTAQPQGVNFRLEPVANSLNNIAGRLNPGETMIANGRLADGSWLHVRHPVTGVSGWIAARLAQADDDLSRLPVVTASAAHFGPMQAFTFQSGSNDAPCAEAPQSGLLIQTPEGGAKVTFLINEVDIQLGSTVFFQAQPLGALVVRVVEGSARVQTPAGIQLALAGAEIAVPLDDSGVPAGPPSPPRPYDMASVSALPVELLPRAIEIAPPLEIISSGVEVAVPVVPATTSSSSQAPGQTGQTPGQTGAPPPGQAGTVPNPPAPPADDAPDLPPGLIDNPGLGDDLPPGHGGSPPGQSKRP